jgi:creatinine amidohydrolase
VRHVCLVNNHLEPAHDTAVRAVVTGRETKVSYACPLTKKWARTLSAEFKSGACHAGRYETSIVMAAAPELVTETLRQRLAPVPISLSEKLKAGINTFEAMGMELAYAGDPAAATVEEGDQLIQRLGEMVVGEVLESLGIKPASD